MFQILIVDDNGNYRHFLQTLLFHAGYKPLEAASCEEALAFIENTRIDLILLDVVMPGMDGYSFTRLLRNCRHSVPILMLSAGHTPADLKKGFHAGADDYMTKPADEEELLLRVKALLRRSRITAERVITVGHTTLFYDSLTVRSMYCEQTLPQKEFYLLYKLLSCPNRIFSRMQLLEDIWGPASNSTDATVSVHINRLRNRFCNCPDFSIVTIRGLGYKAQLKKEA